MSLSESMLCLGPAPTPRPRTIGRLRQERLSSREHMRAVLHSLDLLDLELAPLPVSYRAADAEKHECREMYGGNRAFIFNYESGVAEWVCSPDLEEGGADLGVRVTLHPDEGGPLFCAWQFLASLDLPVGFCRDETPLSSTTTPDSCNPCRCCEPRESPGSGTSCRPTSSAFSTPRLECGESRQQVV